jgi:hypothetical protein
VLIGDVNIHLDSHARNGDYVGRDLDHCPIDYARSVVEHPQRDSRGFWVFAWTCGHSVKVVRR